MQISDLEKAQQLAQRLFHRANISEAQATKAAFDCATSNEDDLAVRQALLEQLGIQSFGHKNRQFRWKNNG